jgi:hypothetical protein
MTATAGTVAAAFSAFDSAIALDSQQRKRAQERHLKVTEVLVSAGVAASTFLQGSFARKTMRRPLKDVDVVVLLPDAFAEQLPAPFGPGKAFELFKQPLRDAFRETGVQFDVTARPGKALQVVFADCDFTFDLVAAFPVAGSEDVLIADRDERRWEPSNTRTLKRLIGERNVATGGVFVHQVRMVKELKAQHPELETICGLVVESLTYRAVTRKVAAPDAIAATLRFAATAVLGPVFDPTGVDDLAAGWSRQQRQTFAVVFAAAADRAEEALRLQRAGDEPAAVEAWRALLGEEFPSAPKQSAAQALRGLAAGSVTSTGRVTPTQAGVQVQRPTRSWRSQ